MYVILIQQYQQTKVVRVFISRCKPRPLSRQEYYNAKCNRWNGAVSAQFPWIEIK